MLLSSFILGNITGYYQGNKTGLSDASRLTGQQAEIIYLKGKYDALQEIKKMIKRKKEIML